MIQVVTIDGPSGSGKGTIGRSIAQLLGWHFLDSGAMYRITALAAEQQGVAFDDAQALALLASDMDVTFAVEGEGVLLNGQPVTDAIRTETCGNNASKVAALTPVRDALLDRQRAFRQAPGLVADGRDMGTVVFPDAPVKVFLTASAEKRAERRYKQLSDKGLDVTLTVLVDEIKERDRRDSERAVAPLKPADDAVLIDSSELSIQQVVDRVMDLIQSAK